MMRGLLISGGLFAAFMLAFLGVLRAKWIEEGGGVVPGCDGGERQAEWESPMDCLARMTEEDAEAVEVGRAKGKVGEESAIKKVARRFEAEKVEVLERRGVKEGMRFDPKLKARGLLDLHTERAKDEVPKEKPKGP